LIAGKFITIGTSMDCVGENNSMYQKQILNNSSEIQFFYGKSNKKVFKLVLH